MVRICDPFHGAVLNHRMGVQSADGLAITVNGEAPLGLPVQVNGIAARRCGERFEADLTLRDPETEITAVCNGPAGSGTHSVRALWDRAARPRYRLSIDDNSFFLRDIAQQRYGSLFDCFYLRMLRDLNRTYGLKVVLNLFFGTPEEDFDLGDFPATYRNEWADNAGWLKLAFHAYNEFPDRPYQHTKPQTLAADFDAVGNEVLRFAGAASWSPPTVLHWAMCQPATLKLLAERGVRALSGFFMPTQDGDWDINYMLDDRRSEYLFRHDALKDFASGIVFSRVDIVINATPLERVVPTLEALRGTPALAEVMDLFTHEQYSWDFYHNYVPDHAQRIEAAVRFCTENGYEPVFLHEGLLGIA